ncbi:hypothetical protein HY230_09575 [Candidatus Acetothermia bacterium]|nr:hypothetical protein [Candidatus Acetothermia bacterium]
MQMPLLTTLISMATWTKVILLEDLDRELGEGMGENKRTRRKIASLERRITQHEGKIEAERTKPRPKHWRIEYWQKEITSWSEQVSRLHRRLPQARKKDD